MSRLAVLAVLAFSSTVVSVAGASPPLITAEALFEGADAIVDGRVESVLSRWDEKHTRLSTTVVVSVTSVLKGDVSGSITIEQPGGELDGSRHIIAGMPTFHVGERARLHLRRTGAQRYRVYGWAQGKTVLAAAKQNGSDPDVLGFEHNGMRWLPGQLPIPFLFGQDGSDDIELGLARAAVLRAFARWEQVPCSTLGFVDMGDTDLETAIDGIQIVRWIESGWIFGEEAAGATSLFFTPGETPTADIALNGEHYTWADGVPDVGPATQDIEGVMTHELGHFVGLGHAERSIDTMYFSWTPWQSQRSLSADDKLGLCALYPAAGVVHECDDGPLEENGCDEDVPCETFASGRLCSPQPDPLGASCNRNRVECGGFCLYTALDLSSGFCSRFCDELDCPPGFECMNATAGTEPVRVCFGAAACDAQSPCAAGRFCGVDGICTFECREDIDCSDDGTCETDGRCAPPIEEPPTESGCGCSSSGGGGLSLTLLLFAFLGGCRRSWLR